jgi:hypothetical protein
MQRLQNTTFCTSGKSTHTTAASVISRVKECFTHMLRI